MPIERVRVKGEPGLWIRGSLADSPHVFVYHDATGAFREETLRLAGPTLLWAAGPLTYRLEGDFTRDEALAVARALH
jgi:hypothetical protein